MQLTEHFSLNELIRSQSATRLGIDEQFAPADSIKENLKDLCIHVLEPIRTLIDEPIHISSGYRCERLNELIGGAKTSQHVKGQAVDFEANSIPNEDLYKLIKESGIVFDQLIFEFGNSGWLHISYCSTEGENRQQCLKAIKVDGVTKYISDVSA